MSNKLFDDSLSIPSASAIELANVCGSFKPNLKILNMNYHIDIQHASEDTIPISDEVLINWAILTLKPLKDSAELTLRFVDSEEITYLNHMYRKINKATNVLAFPASYPDDIALDFPLLGDVIICPKILLEESHALNKPLSAHWAHIVIHGVLHLLGYDHIKDDEATIMQTMETQLLLNLGFDDPYESIEKEANQIE